MLIPVQVVHGDGEVETILLDGNEGVELNNIVSSDGRIHYFDKQGRYDGWLDKEARRG